MKTPANIEELRDVVALEKYGCRYAELPDDGAKQDYVSGEADRLLALPRYANTPHKTIEDICTLAKDRVAAGELPCFVKKDLIEGFGFGYESKNAIAIEAAADAAFAEFLNPTLAAVKPVCSDLIKARHTPGPWKAQKDCRGMHNIGTLTAGPMAWGVYGESRVAVCEEEMPWRTQSEVDANAALIAAAPSLLAALEKIVRIGGASAETAIARAAIAAAKA